MAMLDELQLIFVGPTLFSSAFLMTELRKVASWKSHGSKSLTRQHLPLREKGLDSLGAPRDGRYER